MAALAEILAARGAVLSGSDLAETFQTQEILDRLGLQPSAGFAAADLPPDTEWVIHSAAYDRRENPQLLAAAERGIPLSSYPEALGELSRTATSVAISGVHGKTTTTALCGLLVAALELPATVLTATGVPNFGGGSTLLNGSRYLVAETCEYRNHFAHFRARHLVITTVELEHVDAFPTYAAVAAAFTGLAHSLLNDPEGLDTMLLQFPAYQDNPEQSRTLQQELEDLWRGDDGALTVTSGSVVAVAVADQITEGQTTAISTTVAVALGILALFFWITLRQPALGFVAVGPIVLVLISVLGTMALLDIPYSLITSIITALSIGIGVDYTIHVIHRYREEFTRLRNPEKAAVQTLATTGSALLGSALTTAFGFGVLIASPLLASQQFGITATITIVYSLIVSIFVVLPAMVVWGAYQNMRMRSMVERTWAELDVAIEDVHRRHEREQGLS